MNATPEYDVIVAVHTPERPVERAVASVIDHTDADVRVTVVCHGVAPEAISARLGVHAADARVRLMHHVDGRRSPAGPFNAGLEIATAPFFSVLGSDDRLEPHAIDSWLRIARRTGAKAVVPRLAFASGLRTRTPLARPLRWRSLDPVRDRLSYRTAQLGLLAREAYSHLRFSEGIATGEDVPFGLRVWFSGERIALDRGGPAYYIHDDRDGDRTTMQRRSVGEEFAFLDHVLAADWFEMLPERSRRSIVVKLLRAHLVPSILRRAAAEGFEGDLADLAVVGTRLRTVAPGAERVLSIRDARLLRALGTGQAEVRSVAATSTSLLAPARLATIDVTRSLAVESPIRVLGAALFSPS